MHPQIYGEILELIDDEAPAERSGPLPPESFNRRRAAPRTRKRARRSRSNDMAKRGMHQRRNKRSRW